MISLVKSFLRRNKRIENEVCNKVLNLDEICEGFFKMYSNRVSDLRNSSIDGGKSKLFTFNWKTGEYGVTKLFHEFIRENGFTYCSSNKRWNHLSKETPYDRYKRDKYSIWIKLETFEIGHCLSCKLRIQDQKPSAPNTKNNRHIKKED